MFCSVDGIGKQIGQNLHHGIRVNQRIGKRWIKLVLDLYHLPGSRLDRPPRTVYQRMDIDRLRLRWLIGRQGLHPVEQIDHPLDFPNNHLGQGFLGLIHLAIQKLSGASYRSKWVFDFVTEDVRSPDRQI